MSGEVKKLQNINDSLLTRELYELSKTYLDLCLYENSVFYAEKLFCECENEDVRYLLAKGYIGQGKFHQAFHILKDTKGHECRYLYAFICIKLNKFIEAEKGILTQKFFGKGLNNKELDDIVPLGSYGYFLYGIILEKLNRKIDAYHAYKKSLEIDPFMWCSYMKLCKIEPKKIDINKYFTDLNPKILMFNKKLENIINNPNNTANNLKDKFISGMNNDIRVDSNTINMTSEDNNKNSRENNPAISVANFKISSTSINNGNTSNGDINKYRSILDFSSNSNNANNLIGTNNNNNNNIINTKSIANTIKITKNNIGDSNSNDLSNNDNFKNHTPSIHKNDDIDYSKNYLPQKKINNPFNFSSTPQCQQLDFNSISSSDNTKLNNMISGQGSLNDVNNKQNNINNIPESSFSHFNINSSNTNNNPQFNNNSNVLESNKINPFNINTSGAFNNSSNQNNISGGSNSFFNNLNNNSINNNIGSNFLGVNKMNSLFTQNINNNNVKNTSNNKYLLNNIEISPDNNKLNPLFDNNNLSINNKLNFSSSENNNKSNIFNISNINEDDKKNFKTITQLLKNEFDPPLILF